jgi:hypothetical protein
VTTIYDTDGIKLQKSDPTDRFQQSLLVGNGGATVETLLDNRQRASRFQ